MFLKDNEISHDFGAFNMTDLNYITASFKEQSAFLPSSLGSPEYSFQCLGAKILSSIPSSNSRIQVEYWTGNTKIALGISNDASEHYKDLTLVSDDLAVVTYHKDFCYITG